LSLEEALAADGEFAPGWDEQNEPTLIGTLISRSTRAGKYGEYPIDTLEREDGNRVAVHRSSKILREDLESAKIGDKIGIRALGRHPEKGYKRYRVVIERAEESA
jgi:hypothetical protein